ncbi:HupE/UreJ family protein, partial [Paenibacillus phytorum]|uniref:HupE/UreJ family protein n=1 Tax=Paenibacillus phytorum TaxID=2654977 RepID=UPI001FE9FDFD
MQIEILASHEKRFRYEAAFIPVLVHNHDLIIFWDYHNFTCAFRKYAVLWKYFKLGIEHILTGYDHLLFLLSLVLIASRFKDALKIVTSFT